MGENAQAGQDAVIPHSLKGRERAIGTAVIHKQDFGGGQLVKGRRYFLAQGADILPLIQYDGDNGNNGTALIGPVIRS
ncbi:hypothetical protein JCM25156A_13610 [Komagataeibacter kakiaceti JCM 25156]